ncbi:hypothetical protein ACHAWF_008817 [Thalassiosira exigua]
MAAVNLDSAIIETKDVLQPLFARPKLSTKLLSKPPFRFIHDIIIATLRTTGFPGNGFFTLEELDSSNFKDSKAGKVSFLNKLIHLVNVGNGSKLEINSSKIVAGLEPIRTNLLLSTFGRLAQDSGLDRQRLIQHCLAGKGIDEFLLRTPLADVTQSPGDKNVTMESAAGQQPTIMEAIQACNGESIEKTRAMISEIVAKPKCSDKLLGKPPFRFIHDLIMAIGNETKFNLRQIFSEDELISSNVKDKQPKLQFLEKLINFLEGKLEISVDVNPTKIISGLAPERTRYLLQIFTVVATTKCLDPVDRNQGDSQNNVNVDMDQRCDKSIIDEKGEELPMESVNAKEHDNNASPVVDRAPKECNGESPEEIVEVQAAKPESPPSNSKEGRGVAASNSPKSVTGKPSHVEAGKDELIDSITSSLFITHTRPETAHGQKIEEAKKDPIDSIPITRPATAVVGGEANDESKEVESKEVTRGRVEPSFIDSAMDEKRDDLSIFQQIVREGRSKEERMEATEANDLDSSIRFQRSANRNYVSEVNFPARALDDSDFDSLADAIQHMAQSMTALGQYLDGVPSDVENLTKERNQWVAERELNRDASLERMGPLRDKLASLEDEVKLRASEIRELEFHVRKNDKLLKKRGSCLAY